MKENENDVEVIRIEEDDLKNEETYVMSGDQVMGSVRRLMQETNVRRITVRKPDGSKLFSLPMGAGLVGLGLLPFLPPLGIATSIAVGAAWLNDYRIEVERKD
jgi:hypothetical protein